MTTRVKYWCEKNLLITVEGPSGRSRTTVEKPFARIGSHLSSEVVLPGPQVAQRGFYLHATDEGVYCVDLLHNQSAARVGRGWLQPDQVITLGPYKISAQLAEGYHTVVVGRADLDAKGTVAGPFPRLAVSIEGRGVAKRRLRRQLTLFGRGQAATVQLLGNYISAVHCVMYWDDHALWVVDLLSANGTTLEGECIEAVELPLGRSLMLGNVQLTFAAMAGQRESEAGQTRPGGRTSGPTAGAGWLHKEAAGSATFQSPERDHDPTTERHDGAELDLPIELLEEEGDELFDRVTNRLVQLDRTRRRRRRWKRLLIALTILLIVAGGAVSLWWYCDHLPGGGWLDSWLDAPQQWTE